MQIKKTKKKKKLGGSMKRCWLTTSRIWIEKMKNNDMFGVTLIRKAQVFALIKKE
jgi:hypothetical protein